MAGVKKYFENFLGDYSGGLAGMLVAFPSTIAYGLMCFAPMGPRYTSWAVMGALLGSIPICFLAPFFGGIKTMISAPTAATAAVISVYVAELVKAGNIPVADIPVLITALCIFTGLVQMIVGKFGGGRFIKYIPSSVITGYLNGLCLLIVIGQLPGFLGLPKQLKLLSGITDPAYWKWESMTIAAITIIAMLLAVKFLKKLPAVIVGLFAGIVAYWIIAVSEPSLRVLDNNPYTLGGISGSSSDLLDMVHDRWASFSHLNIETLSSIIFPGLEIMLILTITALNSCLVIDTITFTHHSPKRELIAQGLGNIAAGLFCGIPVAGSLTPTVENIGSGGKSFLSVVFTGINTLLLLLFLMNFVSWIPLPSLAGILIVVAIRLMDFKIFSLLMHRSTIIDFIVIMVVIVAAVEFDLIKAGAVGIVMAILLFIKEQMGATVIRRKIFGNQIFSKKVRIELHHNILEKKGTDTIIIQLHGQLFFGTADQLYSKIEPYFSTCKYFVLDMDRIQSIDYSSANVITKILARITEKNGFLIFSSVPETSYAGQKPKKYLDNFGFFDKENVKLFNELDSSLTWIEDQILIEENENEPNTRILDLNEIEFFKVFSENYLDKIRSCVVEKKYNEGEFVFRSSELPQDMNDEIYFVRKGHIRLVLPLKERRAFHLQTICLGGNFGEMAFIDNSSRSADAIAVEETYLYALSRDKFNKITALYPEIGSLFFEQLALGISFRLRKANAELIVLHEN